MVQVNQQQPIQRALREERFFDAPPARALPMVRAAVQEATGAQLSELADGMWEGRVPVKSGYREVTVRALPTERGTNVEITLEDHASPLSVALWGTLFIVLAMFIVPLFFMIAYMQRAQREDAKQRLIVMHKTWQEITGALGAPERSSYRDAPRRIYVPAEEQAARERQAESAASAEEELELAASKAKAK